MKNTNTKVILFRFVSGRAHRPNKSEMKRNGYVLLESQQETVFFLLIRNGLLIQISVFFFLKNLRIENY